MDYINAIYTIVIHSSNMICNISIRLYVLLYMMFTGYPYLLYASRSMTLPSSLCRVCFSRRRSWFLARRPPTVRRVICVASRPTPAVSLCSTVTRVFLRSATRHRRPEAMTRRGSASRPRPECRPSWATSWCWTAACGRRLRRRRRSAARTAARTATRVSTAPVRCRSTARRRSRPACWRTCTARRTPSRSPRSPRSPRPTWTGAGRARPTVRRQTCSSRCGSGRESPPAWRASGTRSATRRRSSACCAASTAACLPPRASAPCHPPSARPAPPSRASSSAPANCRRTTRCRTTARPRSSATSPLRSSRAVGTWRSRAWFSRASTPVRCKPCLGFSPALYKARTSLAASRLNDRWRIMAVWPRQAVGSW